VGTRGRMADRSALFAEIRAAWGADTSADPAWSPARRSRGQCAVTALVVQDHLGGRLLRAEIGTASHYWNLVGSQEIDLTRDQFAEFTPVGVAGRSREQVLSHPGTALRYELLRARVAAGLAG